MNEKEKLAWDTAKQWLQDFSDGKRVWETQPAADVLTLICEAEEQ